MNEPFLGLAIVAGGFLMLAYCLSRITTLLLSIREEIRGLCSNQDSHFGDQGHYLPTVRESLSDITKLMRRSDGRMTRIENDVESIQHGAGGVAKELEEIWRRVEGPQE